MKRRRNLLVAALLGASLFGSGCGEGAAKPPPAEAPTFLFENPLRDAEPGEWARYRLYDGQGALWTQIFRGMDPDTLQWKVQEVTRDPVTNVEQNRELRLLHPNDFLRGFDTARMVITRIYPDRIFVAEREWDCLCVEFVGRLQGQVRCWYSNDVPVRGLVKQVKLQGEERLVISELVDWSDREGGSQRR